MKDGLLSVEKTKQKTRGYKNKIRAYTKKKKKYH